MKSDYTHEQMANTIVVRVFPELVTDLDLLVEKQPQRFENRAHVARCAIIYALNQPTFINFGHPNEVNQQ